MSEKKIPRQGQKASYLTLLVGKDKQQVRVRMKDKGIIIGRNTKRSSVDFDTKPFDGIEKGVSREHVLIAPKSDYFYVQDLDTINSTWHNKVRMKAMVAEELYHGDVLHLGELRIDVFYTYEDEIQADLGLTKDFSQAPQTRRLGDPNVSESQQSTRILGDDRPTRDEHSTGKLNDNLD